MGAAVFDALVDDNGLGAGEVVAEDAIRSHRRLLAGSAGGLIGSLIVPDHRLGEIGRAAGDDPIRVCVVNTGGAGGLLALSRRSVSGVEVVAVQSALRDLDDLAGNAARVASAAGELDPGIEVFVEIPPAPGWVGAVDEVEARGLLGAVRVGGAGRDDVPGATRLAEQLSGFVEADLPFALVGGPDRTLPSASGRGLLAVMVALDALIDGAEVDDAAALLDLADEDRIRAAVCTWDDAAGIRIRRRLRSIGARSPGVIAAELHGLGHLGPRPPTGT